MWIFGYGSLVWKVDFPYQIKLPGYIKGFARRFWQGSVDHRGTPGKPGRVATLIPSSDPEEKVWGVAYRIADDQATTVTDHLDYRERSGYQKYCVTFHPSQESGEKPFDLQIYNGDSKNPFYLGPADIKEIAEQIFQSEGPSGKNTEYLLNLAETIRTIAPNHEDIHLFDLEKQVKKMMELSAGVITQ